MKQEIVCKCLNQIYTKLRSKEEFFVSDEIETKLPCQRSLTFWNITGGFSTQTFYSWIRGDLK